MPVEKQLGEISDGEVLAADVLDAQGSILLAQGTRLTRAHLQLLERRAIMSVSVLLPEDAGAGPGGADAARLVECLARQEQVFSKVRQNPRMEAIYQAARHCLIGGHLPPV
jgi:hypothetical protein